MKKKIPRPMSARPAIGPTTAPAIQALLSSFGCGSGLVRTGTVGAAGGVEVAAMDDVVVPVVLSINKITPFLQTTYWVWW